MTGAEIRDLTSIDQFKQVVDLERQIWGYTDSSDMVGVPVFIFTVHRGAVLIGAFDRGLAPNVASDRASATLGASPQLRMVGFSYAVVGMKAGRPMLWSHMTGVLPDHRGGLGYQLKLAQRERALAQGYDLIEWTFDPMQAMNAHFNLTKLGGVVTEYAPNFYGESTSALHRGTPTDRVVLSWHIGAPHVVRRLEHRGLGARAQEVTEAPVANTTVMDGEWRRNVEIDLGMTERRVWLEIPTGFTDMLRTAPDRALRWRLDLRAMFEAYLSKGYRAVDFVLQREAGFGRYLLSKD